MKKIKLLPQCILKGTLKSIVLDCILQAIKLFSSLETMLYHYRVQQCHCIMDEV